jgi:tRNA 2-thiouridine synthesizing protein E
MQLETDKDGYLKHLSDWSPDVAEWLAEGVNVTLNKDHWDVIHALRNFYADTGISPAMRILVKIVKQKVSLEKGNSIHLLTLFPGSPAKIAAKIAGLPRPTNCL